MQQERLYFAIVQKLGNHWIHLAGQPRCCISFEALNLKRVLPSLTYVLILLPNLLTVKFQKMWLLIYHWFTGRFE